METRLKIQDVQPAAWKTMYELSTYLAGTKLTKTQMSLITIRASQINGCAFCIDMHTKEALKGGENNQRLFLLNAWRETDKFLQEERVLLAMTEEITLISHRGLTDETYSKAKELFSDEMIAQIIMAIVTINGWNRIAISTQMPVAS
jgi:AhpD family alkylhydroperoxidase